MMTAEGEMNDHLVRRLRDPRLDRANFAEVAAARIEALEAQVREMRELLANAATVIAYVDDLEGHGQSPLHLAIRATLTGEKP